MILGDFHPFHVCGGNSIFSHFSRFLAGWGGTPTGREKEFPVCDRARGGGGGGPDDDPGSAALAENILAFAREHLAPYKRVRRIEFVTELPKTISGKIRRVELRQMEVQRRQGERGAQEYFEEDFPQLKG